MHASAELRADREIVLAAINETSDVKERLPNHGSMLEHVSEELKADREIVRAAVRQDFRALQHASADLRKDAEIVKLAAEGRHAPLSVLPPGSAKHRALAMQQKQKK